jgi:hypothetical protein
VILKGCQFRLGFGDIRQDDKDRGVVTQVTGLYFAGLPWLDTQKIGLLLGVGESADLMTGHNEAS